MKIGPINVSISTLVYLALVVVVAIANFQLYMSREAQRLEGRMERPIRDCHADGSDEALKRGVELCRQVTQAAPDSVAAHLHLGSLLHRLSQFKDAQAAFEAAAKVPNVSNHHAAMAYTGAAVCAFAQVPAGERSKQTAAAEALLKQALAASKDDADAKACLGILTLWKGGLSAPAEALALFNEALGAKRPPARLMASRLYNARGVALSRLGRASEADESFQGAGTIDPGWKPAKENRTLTLISSLGLPGMPVETRMKLIDQYKGDLSPFAPHQYAARNSLAMGLWLTRKDVMSKVYLEKHLPLAEKILNEAIAEQPANPMAYRNLAGLYHDRIFGDPGEGGRDGLLAQLPPDFFKPQQEAPNRWKEGAATAGPVADAKVLDDVRRLALAEIEIWNRLLAKAKLDSAQQVETQIHVLGLQFLLAVAMPTPQERDRYFDAALKNGAQVLAVAPDHPVALRAYGSLLLRKGEFRKAQEALAKAREKGDGSDELAKALEALARPPEFFDLRPRRGALFGKGRPLFGASVSVRSCPGPLAVTMSIDGQKMEAVAGGTQVLALPYDNQLTDGAHEIVIEAEDAVGNKVRHAMQHAVDKRAPTLKLAPETEADGPRPQWSVTLDDVGVGIDSASVKVELSSLGGGATPCKDLLVVDGTYQKDLPGVGVKAGDKVPGGTFKIEPLRDLTAGNYQLRISFADKAGNVKTELKAVKVR